MKTKVSKFRFLLSGLTLSVIICLFFFSCQKDETTLVKLDEELATQIASDVIFQDMTNESKTLIKTIREKIIENKLYGTKKIEAAQSTEELNQLLCLPDDYLKNSYKSIASKSRLVIEKYNLQLATEKEFRNTFNQLIMIDNSPYRKMVRLKSGSCEEEFEQRFEEIHDSYDRGVYLCLLAGIYGGAGGIVTCEAYNLYNTIYAAAVAIDNYFECIN